MFHQDGIHAGVAPQNPNQFRPAVTAMPDHANLHAQVIEYSFL
jgi:hypothetical protein